jgi:cytoskeletal protein RodZ
MNMAGHHSALPFSSFGTYLKSRRLERGFDLERIAIDTRVPEHILLHIEMEDHDQLPAPVYTKGFIRAFARAVGANGDQAVAQYEASIEMHRQTATNAKHPPEMKSRFWIRLGFSLGALLGLITISLVTHLTSSRQEKSNHPTIHTKSPTRRSPHTVSAPQTVTLTHRKTNSDRLLLKIFAVEDTWLKVTVDNQEPVEYKLNVGDQIELEAAIGYNLIVGNSKGLKLTLNDLPLTIPSHPSRLAKIQIP